MTHIASVVHLSDLHLYVHGDDATERGPNERRLRERLAIAALGTVFHGLATADTTAFMELVDFLPVVVQAEASLGAAVVVVQTGDVEAFGFVEPGFEGYRFLRETLWPRLRALGATCVDIYGNHDIWPGFPPLPGKPQDASQLTALPEFQGNWNAPVEITTGQDVTLRFDRVNTVITNQFAGGILARGGVGPHPPDVPFAPAHIAPTVDRVRGQGGGPGPTLHVLLCHHPPHLFRPTRSTAWTTGYLIGAGELGNLTPDPIALVVAGHRHELDPVVQLDVDANRQPPLRPGAGQLVTQSPTQRDGKANSFSVYRFQHDEARSTVDVDRLVFAYSASSGLRRTPELHSAILSGISVQ